MSDVRKFEEQRDWQREATERVAALIRQKFGADIEPLLALLDDAWPTAILDEMKTPGCLKESDIERKQQRRNWSRYA